MNTSSLPEDEIISSLEVDLPAPARASFAVLGRTVAVCSHEHTFLYDMKYQDIDTTNGKTTDSFPLDFSLTLYFTPRGQGHFEDTAKTFSWGYVILSC